MRIHDFKGKLMQRSTDRGQAPTHDAGSVAKSSGVPGVLQLKGLLAGKGFAAQERMLAPIQKRPADPPAAFASAHAVPAASVQAKKIPSGNGASSPTPTATPPSAASTPAPQSGTSTPSTETSASQETTDQNVAAPQGGEAATTESQNALVLSVQRAIEFDRQLLNDWLGWQREDMVTLESLKAGLPGAQRSGNLTLIAELEREINTLQASLAEGQQMIAAFEDVIALLRRVEVRIPKDIGHSDQQLDAISVHRHLQDLVRDHVTEWRDELAALEAEDPMTQAMEDGHVNDDEQAAINALLLRRQRLEHGIRQNEALIDHLGSVIRDIEAVQWADVFAEELVSAAVSP